MSVFDALLNFHFLRPLWLLSLIPAGLLIYLLMQQQKSSGNWNTIIQEQLLSHLTDGIQQRQSRWPIYGLGVAWLITALALAGPSWNKLPQPVHQKQDALVIVLDLSLSMLAEDIKPSRLTRARHKILDIIAERKEGLTALVAYSGDAHIVTPLTDDTPTIANLVPALSPLMMPVMGSDPVSAIELASEIFSHTGIAQGRVLLMTDGISEKDLAALEGQLQRQGIELSVMGIGTSDGAPIPADNGFLKDNDGNIIVPKLIRPPLEQLAAQNGGRYADIALGNRDIEFLLPESLEDLTDTTVISQREFDQWKDRGPLLAMLLIPFALIAFRRGWLITLALPVLLLPQPGQALEWQDLWQTKDQQASTYMQQGDAESAASTFKDPAWKGSAYYRAEDYDSAAQQFSSDTSAEGHYNRGNALARAGKLQEAIDAYGQALQMYPEMEDAVFNKALVEKALQQQQEQQQGDQTSDDNQQQSSDSSNKSEPQNSQQQNSQQQSADNQSQDQSSQSDSISEEGQQAQSGEESSEQQSDQEQQNANEQQASQDKPDEQGEEPAQSAQPNDEQSTDEENTAQHQQPMQQSDEDSATTQQRLATEQWLRQIPDDPSGLLRRKFQHESRLRQQNGEAQREQPTW